MLPARVQEDTPGLTSLLVLSCTRDEVRLDRSRDSDVDDGAGRGGGEDTHRLDRTLCANIAKQP